MATLLTANKLTLIELAKRTKDGKVLAIAEVLNKVNTILDDAVWVQANGETSHVTTKRRTLPAGSWRKLNSGVALEKSETTQIVDTIGMLESYAQVDVALVELNPDPMAFRLSEDLAFVEGMSQTLASAIMYSTSVGYPEKFDGLATRYATLTTLGTSDVHNVHSCSGTGSACTSVWIVQWGTDKVHMIYPKNSDTIGLKSQDDGVQTVYDASGNPYKVYQTHFKQYCGMSVRDDRCVQRVANVHSTRATGTWSDDKMVDAIRQLPQTGGAVIYANVSVLGMMDKDAKDKSNVQYGPADAWGRPTMYFRGIPVKQVDALLNTESAIT